MHVHTYRHVYTCTCTYVYTWLVSCTCVYKYPNVLLHVHCTCTLNSVYNSSIHVHVHKKNFLFHSFLFILHSLWHEWNDKTLNFQNQVAHLTRCGRHVRCRVCCKSWSQSSPNLWHARATTPSIPAQTHSNVGQHLQCQHKHTAMRDNSFNTRTNNSNVGQHLQYQHKYVHSNVGKPWQIMPKNQKNPIILCKYAAPLCCNYAAPPTCMYMYIDLHMYIHVHTCT